MSGKFSKGNTRASRLTAEQVYAIRQRWAQRLATQRQLALDYDVTITTISNIVHGLTWQNVGMVSTEEEEARKIAESQRLLATLLEHDAGDAEIHKQILELEPERPPEPKEQITDYASAIVKMAEDLRKRKAEIQQAEEETRTDDTPDGDNK